MNITAHEIVQVRNQAFMDRVKASSDKLAAEVAAVMKKFEAERQCAAQENEINEAKKGTK